MTLQTIKSMDGKDEYVLLPVAVFKALEEEIVEQLEHLNEGGYVPFLLEDYVDNPVALARMKAHVTQKKLAERMGVSQAYISKIERQESVTPALLKRVKAVLK